VLGRCRTNKILRLRHAHQERTFRQRCGTVTIFTVRFQFLLMKSYGSGSDF
jgi:hypothetical protein